MRASVSVVLALLLSVTPILQVHGQARQQGSSPPDSTAFASRTSDARSVVVLEPAWAPWVPTLDGNRAGVADSLSELQPAPTSAAGWVGIVVVTVLLVGVLIFAAVCATGGGFLCD